MNQGHYSELSEDERAELMKRSYRVQEMLAEAFREYKELEKSIKEQIKNLERDTARAASAPYFDELMSRYNGLIN